jgi:hypothetical protein
VRLIITFLEMMTLSFFHGLTSTCHQYDLTVPATAKLPPSLSTHAQTDLSVMLSSTLRLLKRQRKLSMSCLAKKYWNARSPFNLLANLNLQAKRQKLP